MSNNLKVELPGVDFTGMAQQAIAAKLTEALVGADDSIRRIVATAMSQKVNDKGQVDSYSYANKIPYVEWLAQDLIRGAALLAMQKKIETLRPKIEAEIEKQIKASTGSIAKSLTEDWLRTIRGGYGISISVGIVRKD